MDWALVVGNIALVCTIASNFSGLPVCSDFFRKRSTGNASVLPFLAGTICTCLWLMYSIILGDKMLQTVNGIAVLLQSTYLLCYYINTEHKARTRLMSYIAMAFLFLSYVYGFHIADGVTARRTAGYLASAGSITACSAPLATAAEVFRTRNSASLPLPIIFSSFVVSSLWYFYGVLVNDAFIQVPNFIGTVICGFQLFLIACYPAKKVKDSSNLKSE